MPKKIKRERIPCPVDPYCRNWDQHNEYCPEGGCRASGYNPITRADAPFYINKRIIQSELQIARTKDRERRNKLKLVLDTVNYNE